MRPSKLLRLYAGTTSLFLNRRWGGEKKTMAVDRGSVVFRVWNTGIKMYREKKKGKQQQQDKSLTTRVSRGKEKTNISVVGKFSVELAR